MGKTRAEAPTPRSDDANGRWVNPNPNPDNQIRALRERRGLSQVKLAKVIGVSQQQMSKLELGERPLTTRVIRQIATAVDCAPEDVFGSDQPLQVPETMVIASAHSDDAPITFELSEPLTWQRPLPSIRRTRGVFAASVADDSADLKFPPGSLLFARELDALEEPLRCGDEVLVRRLTERGETLDILYGLLDRTVAGDIIVVLRSSDAASDDLVVVRKTQDAPGMSEAPRGWGDEATIDYAPRDGDKAEIIAKVELGFPAKRLRRGPAPRR